MFSLPFLHFLISSYDRLAASEVSQVVGIPHAMPCHALPCPVVPCRTACFRSWHFSSVCTALSKSLGMPIPRRPHAREFHQDINHGRSHRSIQARPALSPTPTQPSARTALYFPRPPINLRHPMYSGQRGKKASVETTASDPPNFPSSRMYVAYRGW